MKKLLQTIIITLAGLISLVFIGCTLVQDGIVPCYVDPNAAAYADEPLTSIMPWTTIADAKRIESKMDYVYETKKLGYVYFKDNMAFHLLNSEQFKHSIFAPDGALSLLLIGGPMCALGAFGVSKPADKKKVLELERKLNGIKINP